MPHSTKPYMPSKNPGPSPSTATDVAAKLDHIVAAIMPLHHLLQAQENTDESLTNGLAEILRDLQLNADALKTSADALDRLVAAEHLPPAHHRAFDAQAARMDQLDARIAELHGDLQTLMNWLGAEPGRAVAPASSGR